VAHALLAEKCRENAHAQRSARCSRHPLQRTQGTAAAAAADDDDIAQMLSAF